MPQPAFTGYSAASRLATAVSSSRAWASVRPGASRANTSRSRDSRAAFADNGASGIHAFWRKGNLTRGGRTPITVYGRALRVTARPTIAGSAL